MIEPSAAVAALNILWQDLPANPGKMPSPIWNRSVLAHQMADSSIEPKLPIDAAFDVLNERLDKR